MSKMGDSESYYYSYSYSYSYSSSDYSDDDKDDNKQQNIKNKQPIESSQETLLAQQAVAISTAISTAIQQINQNRSDSPTRQLSQSQTMVYDENNQQLDQLAFLQKENAELKQKIELLLEQILDRDDQITQLKNAENNKTQPQQTLIQDQIQQNFNFNTSVEEKQIKQNNNQSQISQFIQPEIHEIVRSSSRTKTPKELEYKLNPNLKQEQLVVMENNRQKQQQSSIQFQWEDITPSNNLENTYMQKPAYYQPPIQNIEQPQFESNQQQKQPTSFYKQSSPVITQNRIQENVYQYQEKPIQKPIENLPQQARSTLNHAPQFTQAHTEQQQPPPLSFEQFVRQKAQIQAEQEIIQKYQQHELTPQEIKNNQVDMQISQNQRENQQNSTQQLSGNQAKQMIAGIDQTNPRFVQFKEVDQQYTVLLSQLQLFKDEQNKLYNKPKRTRQDMLRIQFLEQQIDTFQSDVARSKRQLKELQKEFQ